MHTIPCKRLSMPKAPMAMRAQRRRIRLSACRQRCLLKCTSFLAIVIARLGRREHTRAAYTASALRALFTRRAIRPPPIISRRDEKLYDFSRNACHDYAAIFSSGHFEASARKRRRTFLTPPAKSITTLYLRPCNFTMPLAIAPSASRVRDSLRYTFT